MGIYLNPKNAGFKEAIRSEIYVDKTGLIRELLDNWGKVNLFTRPRRFGKSLNMSMLRCFFEYGCDSTLFDGLEIAGQREYCQKYMGKFPVILITLKGVDARNYEEAAGMLRSIIGTAALRFQFLADSPRLSNEDKSLYRQLIKIDDSGKQGFSMPPEVLADSLRMLSELLRKHYGQNVILLIDEYDVPLDKAQQAGYYDEMVTLIRSLFGQALKTNEFLQFAVLTGCLRVSKESIFTGTNNFSSYSVLDADFSGFFGFTGDEVTELLLAADREDKAEMIKEWYDGYVFGDSFVYCPWDVMNYLSALKKRRNAKPKNYWKNTSHNGVLLTFVKRTDFKVKGKFEILMNKGTIIQTVSDDLTYDTLHSSEDHLWSVLLMTGYLTKADEKEEGETVRLRIPNREIASIFEDTVVELFRQTIDNSARKSMMDALWNGDEQEASKVISDLLWRTISYNDYHEDYYHAFLAGVFVGLGYEVESNKEKGLGRPDILLKDDDNRRAMIIEAKRSMKEEDMDQDCDAAVSQIVNKKYADGLCGYTRIRCYGIAFFQKHARVKRMQ